MPELKEYGLDSQVGGPIQTRRLSAEEISTSSGDQAIAAGLGEVGTVAHHIDIQQKRAKAAVDLSALNASLSASHAQSEVDLQAALKASPNGDPKIVQDTLDAHDAAMSELSANIKTDAGRKYFTARSAQIRGQLLMSAAHGQSQLAGKASVDQVKQAVDAGTVAINSDPTVFGKQLEAFQGFTDANVKYAGLDAIHKTELDNRAGNEFAKAAVESWLKTGVAAPGPGDVNGADIAKEKLDNKEFDKYLSGDDKNYLYGKVQRTYRAQDAERALQQKEADRLKDAKDEVTNQGFLQDFTDHKLDTKTILQSDLYEKDKEHWIHMLKADATGGWHSDKNRVSDILRRMDLPPGDPNRISSQAQIMKYVGTNDQGQINMSDATKLTHYYEKGTPQREADAKSWSDFRNTTWAQIAKPDPVTKLPSTPELGLYADHVRQELRDQELKYREKGISAAEAINPHNANFVGNKVHLTPPNMMDRVDSMIKSIAPSGRKPNSEDNGAYNEPPKVGEVRGGFMFSGGDWKDKANWIEGGGRSPQSFQGDMKALEDHKANKGPATPVDDQGNILNEKGGKQPNRSPAGHESDMQAILDYEEKQRAKDKSAGEQPNTKARKYTVTGTTKDGHKIVRLE